MSFRFELVAGVLIAGALIAAHRAATRISPALRVCADPNNLPFSNQREQGFENRIASIVAADLHLPVRYTWWPQRRGFIRNTLNAGRCDVIMGIPAGLEAVAPTTAYYRSTYVFVTRRDRKLQIRSLDDPSLRRLRIGIHFAGEDYENPPAAQALARRGLARNVVGYSLYGDYSKPNPPADLITAVARGDVAVAIAWGPLAGYFAQRAPVPLTVVPVTPSIDPPLLPFAFDIAAGVRRGDTVLRGRIQQALDRHRNEIHEILQSYGVPLMGAAER